MKVVVVGATGVLGRNVIPRLVERGHTVRAIVRRADQARLLEQMGVETRLGDIFDLDALNDAAQGCDVALHLATAIPRSGEKDWSLNDRIRREGTLNFIGAATGNGVKRYIQQSIVMLYGDYGHEIVDESAPLRPTPVIQSAADMEEMVRTSALDWCILRGGHFYGPGTGREDEWRQAAREGRLMLPGDGSAWISLVHVVDMARVVVAAAEGAPLRSVFNVVDDEPVRYKQVFDYIAAQVGAPEPQPGGPKILSSLRCSNAKIKRELAWQPAYPSYRSGLA
jgi:nucleoside-diphosphate-sugar epimerase